MQTKTAGWRRAFAVLLAASLIGTSACTSLHVVPLSGTTAPTPAVEVGDRVVVTRKSGEQQEFKVTGIEADALVGVQTRVAYDDISRLEVRRVDKGKTAGLVSLIVGTVLLVAAQFAKGYTDLVNSAP